MYNTIRLHTSHHIMLTTNHKERLDPALLRFGHMDVHIHLSCTRDGFKLLARNYLRNKDHEHALFGEVKGLIENTNVTPTEVAGQLLRSDLVEIALPELINLLQQKKGHGRKKSEVGDGNKLSKPGKEGSWEEESNNEPICSTRVISSV